MLSKINRLRSDKDFKKVFGSGKTAENPFVRIKFVENQQKETRFGFIVGIKFSKKAAARNLIKRRLRAATRFLIKNVKPGFDIVIWPKPKSESANYEIILQNLEDVLNKNDILFIQ